MEYLIMNALAFAVLFVVLASLIVVHDLVAMKKEAEERAAWFIQEAPAKPRRGMRLSVRLTVMRRTLRRTQRKTIRRRA